MTCSTMFSKTADDDLGTVRRTRRIMPTINSFFNHLVKQTIGMNMHCICSGKWPRVPSGFSSQSFSQYKAVLPHKPIASNETGARKSEEKKGFLQLLLVLLSSSLSVHLHLPTYMWEIACRQERKIGRRRWLVEGKGKSARDVIYSPSEKVIAIRRRRINQTI